jgi:hypothetical protein
MPVVRTEYAAGVEIPDLIQRDLGATLSYPLYRDDAVVPVTQAGSTFSLRKPDGNLLIGPAAVTVGGDGIPTYAIAAGTIANEPFQMGYRAEWSLVVAGVTSAYRNEVGIVRCAPPLPISDRNLTGRHSKLDTWLQGTGKTTWQSWIDMTWYEVQRWLIQRGNRAHRIFQTSDLVDLVRVWTMFNILRDVVSSQNGEKFRELYTEYKDELKALQDSTTFAYSQTDEATPDRHRRTARPVTFLGTSGWPDEGRGYGYDPDGWMP